MTRHGVSHLQQAGKHALTAYLQHVHGSSTHQVTSTGGGGTQQTGAGGTQQIGAGQQSSALATIPWPIEARAPKVRTAMRHKFRMISLPIQKEDDLGGTLDARTLYR